MTHRVSGRRAGKALSTLYQAPYEPPPKRDTIKSMSFNLNGCLYFFRSPAGLIKIGYSTEIGNRIRALAWKWKTGPEAVLAVTETLREREQELHAQFARHLADGDTWYRPTTELLDIIDEIRTDTGLPPLDRR